MAVLLNAYVPTLSRLGNDTEFKFGQLMKQPLSTVFAAGRSMDDMDMLQNAYEPMYSAFGIEIVSTSTQAPKQRVPMLIASGKFISLIFVL